MRETPVALPKARLFAAMRVRRCPPRTGDEHCSPDRPTALDPDPHELKQETHREKESADDPRCTARRVPLNDDQERDKRLQEPLDGSVYPAADGETASGTPTPAVVARDSLYARVRHDVARHS